jgi:pimeloyl-ACP methyl ester carboxylesterase
MAYVKIDNKNIHYQISGKGLVLVLLHGYLETHQLWDNILLRLSENYCIICPDLPGQGESEVHSNQTVESMAKAIYDLTQFLKIERFHLFGHSMGGYVTLAFAELFPEKLITFGLLHSHPFEDSIEKKIARNNEINFVNKGKRELIIRQSIPGYFATSFAETHNDIINRSICFALKTNDDGMKACITAMQQRPDRLNVLKNSKIPSLWIAGRKDKLFSCNLAIETAKKLENTKFYILEQSGHVGMTEEPEKTIEILTQFLQI